MNRYDIVIWKPVANKPGHADETIHRIKAADRAAARTAAVKMVTDMNRAANLKGRRAYGINDVREVR